MAAVASRPDPGLEERTDGEEALTRARRKKEDEELLLRLDRDALFLAAPFRLRLARLDKENYRVKRRLGSCDSDGVILLRLRNLRTGEQLKYSSLIATLCHELAHLAYMSHGKRFQMLNERILEFARAEGIYRPSAPGGRNRPSPASPSPEAFHQQVPLPLPPPTTPR